MKWINIFFIACLFIIIMTSCSNNENNNPSSDEILNKVLSIEQAEYLLSLWDESDWDPDVTKTACDYRFEFDGQVVRYAPEVGHFIDDTAKRNLTVTKEQRDYINSSIIGVQD